MIPILKSSEIKIKEEKNLGELIYKHLKLIELENEGRGTFANVLKGFDAKQRKFYALKCISIDDNNDEIYRRVFEKIMKEIEILKKLGELNSPLILKYYEHIYDDKKKNMIIVLEHGECNLKEIMLEIGKEKGKYIFEVKHFLYILSQL
jgi:serine/threonine protein kinase